MKNLLKILSFFSKKMTKFSAGFSFKDHRQLFTSVCCRWTRHSVAYASLRRLHTAIRGGSRGEPAEKKQQISVFIIIIMDFFFVYCYNKYIIYIPI